MGYFFSITGGENMFIDQAKMELFGGKGGDGIVAYRRELKIEYGGPFGGNGGNGGSIIFKGSNGMSTLLDLKYNAVLKAEDGERGKNKGMSRPVSPHRRRRLPDRSGK